MVHVALVFLLLLISCIIGVLSRNNNVALQAYSTNTKYAKGNCTFETYFDTYIHAQCLVHAVGKSATAVPSSLFSPLSRTKLTVECGSNEEYSIVSMNSEDMVKMGLEDGAPVAVLGRKGAKSVGIVLSNGQMNSGVAKLHPSMIDNLRCVHFTVNCLLNILKSNFYLLRISIHDSLF